MPISAMAFNSFDGSWPNEVQAESVTLGSAKNLYLLEDLRVTQKGLFKKWKDHGNPEGLYIQGPHVVPYVANGPWSFFYDGDPWLEGTMVNGNMSGEWQLFGYASTKDSTIADFCNLFNKVRNDRVTYIFPFYFDLEGRGHDDIIYFQKGGILILDGKSHEVVTDITQIPVPIQKGSIDQSHTYYRKPTISKVPIWKDGPYCFWYSFQTKEQPSPNEMNNRGWAPRLKHTAFYILLDGKLKLVFQCKSDDLDDESIELKDPDRNGYMQLDCKYFIAKWDMPTKRFKKDVVEH